MEYSEDNPWMDLQKLYLESVAEERYREREPPKKRSVQHGSKRDKGRRHMRFLPTGLFGELEHRQGLRAIKRVCVGVCKMNREIQKQKFVEK